MHGSFAGIASLAICLVLAQIAIGVHVVDERRPDQSVAAACNVMPELSRWQATDGRYFRSAAFGQDAEVLLDRVLGLATSPQGEVLVFDGPNTSIHILDGELKRIGGFGRAGEGPGELFVAQSHHINGPYTMVHWIGVGDSSIVLFDGLRLQRYTLDGGFRERLETRTGLTMGLSVVGIQVAANGVVFGLDSLDLGNPVKRTLMTWRIRDGRRSLVHALALTAPPGTRASVRMGARQARPLWAALETCVVVGDGESPWLLRVDPTTRLVDTVRLPAHEVPAFSAADERGEGGNSQLARMLAQRGIPNDATIGPTAMQRWAELSIDPDGHIWVNPWRPEAARVSPMRVFRIDPSGRVHQEVVPAFPLAFGAPGVFYALQTDPETDEALVARFELRR